jgi:hypothetical protein
MRHAAVVGWIGLLAMAGCSTPAPLRVGDAGVARSRDMQVTPDVARERLATEFQALGFKVDKSLGSGALRAEATDAPQEWASCPTATANDPYSDTRRFSSEEPMGLRVLVVATTTRISGTTVASLEPRYFGQYVNPYTNTTFERNCIATGVLEKKLLDGAASG